MRLHYYCDNCGSEIILQDNAWLGGRYNECPLCGDDTGAFVRLVPVVPVKMEEKENE